MVDEQGNTLEEQTSFVSVIYTVRVPRVAPALCSDNGSSGDSEQSCSRLSGGQDPRVFVLQVAFRNDFYTRCR